MPTGIIEIPDWSKIPAPEDDGATRHLQGMKITSLALPATNSSAVDLASLQGRVVVFAYPRTSRPGIPNPDGWDLIPGARGCTPQACSFRDHFERLKSLGVDYLFGLSTQDCAWQREAVERLNLPFPLLSDESLRLAKAMRFPLLRTNGMTLLKRMTLILQNGVVESVFYPVFPPDHHVTELIAWLKDQPLSL